MTAEEAVKAGQLEDALKALQDAIRQSPADAKLRRFLFQLHCVLGNWEKALTQLQVLSELDSESAMLASIFQPVMQCEMLRAEVFAGKRSPIVFGEPEHWVGLLVQANSLIAQGEAKAARELQMQALDAAPTTSGTLNGQPFEWLADADSRLGPVFEAMIDGKYCWVPMSRIKSLLIEPPKDLRDLVWAPANFIWTNGGDAMGFIPARYPGTERAEDNALKLARKTEWKDNGEEIFTGLGQRLFTTDQMEIPLFEIRTVEFATSAAPADPAPATPAPASS